MAPYVAPTLECDELAAIAREAYATFTHPDVCPVSPLDDGLWLLELFWGPTIAFKDVALQLVGRLPAGRAAAGPTSTSWCSTPPGG